MTNTISLVLFYFYPVFMFSMMSIFHSKKMGQWVIRKMPYVRNLWENLGLFGNLYSKYVSIIATVGYIIFILQLIFLYKDGYIYNLDILLQPIIIISVILSIPNMIVYFCGSMVFLNGVRGIPENAENIIVPSILSILQVVEVKIEKDPENMLTEECQICYNNYDTNLAPRYECRCSVKKACQDCILTYFQNDNRCPWCRDEVNHITKVSYQ